MLIRTEFFCKLLGRQGNTSGAAAVRSSITSSMQLELCLGVAGVTELRARAAIGAQLSITSGDSSCQHPCMGSWAEGGAIFVCFIYILFPSTQNIKLNGTTLEEKKYYFKKKRNFLSIRVPT